MKDRKYVGVVTRRLVGDNLTAALKRHYGEKKNHPMRFEEDFKLGHTTIQNIQKGKSGVSIDTLEYIAWKLEMPVYELFLPTREMEVALRPREAKPGSAHEPMIRTTDEAREPTAPQAKPRRITR